MYKILCLILNQSLFFDLFLSINTIFFLVEKIFHSSTSTEAHCEYSCYFLNVKIENSQYFLKIYEHKIIVLIIKQLVGLDDFFQNRFSYRIQ